MQTRVLLIDDDDSRSPALKRLLSAQYYATQLSSNFDHASDLINCSRFDVIVIQADSLTSTLTNFVTTTRSSGVNTIIFPLLLHATSLERISLLKSGADDCLSSPFHPDEIMLRLAKMLLRVSGGQSPVVKTKTFSFNLTSGQIWGKWGEDLLRKKELMILSILVQNKNQAISKEQMVEQLWGVEEMPIYTTIDVHVRRIRNKIHDSDKTIIKTVHGIGYMFSG